MLATVDLIGLVVVHASFIKEYVPYCQRVDFEVNKECIESTFVEIGSEQGVGLQGVIFGSVYHPPNTNIDVFNSHMSDILVIINRERKAAYIGGDFNINLLNADSHIPSSEFLELVYSNLFLPIINRPTRVTHSTATIIDHIYCNNIKDCDIYQGILYTDISDHFPVFCISLCKLKTNSHTYDLRRQYTEQIFQIL